MGLRINNNIEAQDTFRQLTIASNMFSQSMQRLSSGKRINSAADDAAGYAISQKLHAQSTGLTQAQSNAQDGISLVQTAGGGLQTTQDLLQRLRQLAVQSANDTNTTSDRQALQAEADQISQEITQIASTTQFNTKNLLDGSMGSSASVVTTTIAGTPATPTTAGALKSGTYSFTATGGQVAFTGTTLNQGVGTGTASTAAGTYLSDGTNSIGASGGASALAAGSYSFTINGPKGNATINFTVGATATSGDTYQTILNSINAASNQTGVTAVFNGGAANAGIQLQSAVAGSSQNFTVSASANNVFVALGMSTTATTLALNTTAGVTAGTNGSLTVKDSAGNTVINNLTGNGNTFLDAATGFSWDLSKDASFNAQAGATGSLSVSNTGLTLQVGANANQNISVAVNDMRALALGIQGATSNQALDITTQTNANNAISVIDNAIQTVSAQASQLGSVQNRLQSAMNNLAIQQENMQAAYSSITDVNMAQETTNLATAQILQQSSMAMLAQANQAPMGVLKLLG